MKAAYGEQSLSGKQGTAAVCLDLSTCADDFPYLHMTAPANFDGTASGVVGLARPRKFALAPETPVDSAKLLLEQFTNGTVFSLDFSSVGAEGSPSEITTGTVKVNDDFFWSA